MTCGLLVHYFYQVLKMLKQLSLYLFSATALCGSVMAHANQLDAKEYQLKLEDALLALPQVPSNALQVKLEASFEALNLRNQKREFGQLTTAVRTSPEGLQVSYPAAVINLLNKGRSDDTPSETAFAMEYFDVAELVDLFHPRDAIVERIRSGQLVRIVPIPEQQQLRYEYALPLEALIDDEEFRGYVNEFAANYHLTVTSDFHPVKAELDFFGDGSAYFFFDVNAAGNSIEHYRVHDGYLFVSERNSSQDFASTFSERRFSTTFVASQITDNSGADSHSTASLNADMPQLAVE